MTAHQTVRRRRYSPWVVTWVATATRRGGSRRFATKEDALAYLAGPRVTVRAPTLEYVDRGGWRELRDTVTGGKVPT